MRDSALICLRRRAEQWCACDTERRRLRVPQKTRSFLPPPALLPGGRVCGSEGGGGVITPVNLHFGGVLRRKWKFHPPDRGATCPKIRPHSWTGVDAQSCRSASGVAADGAGPQAGTSQEDEEGACCGGMGTEQQEYAVAPDTLAVVVTLCCCLTWRKAQSGT